MENARRDGADHRSARAHGEAKEDNETPERQHGIDLAQQPEADDRGNRKDVGQHGGPEKTDLEREIAGAEHADRDENANKAELDRRFNGREAGLDHIGHRLDDDREHAAAGEEKDGGEAPEIGRLQGFRDGPVHRRRADRAGLWCLQIIAPGGYPLPRQKDENDEDRQHPKAETELRIPPAVMLDQHLRDGKAEQRSRTERGIDDGEGERNLLAEPAAGERRVRDVAAAGDPETDQQADAEIEMP